MSVKIMAAVWELDLPQNEKLILLAFADHANDDGYCWPSIARIAWKSGYSVRQTQDIAAKIKARGILEPVKHKKGGRGQATVYKTHPEKGAKIAPFRSVNGCSPADERVKTGGQKGEAATAPQSSTTTNEPKTGRTHALSPYVSALEEWMTREWEQRVGKKPTWLPRDRTTLASLFKMEHVTTQEVQRRWLNYLNSQDYFLQSQGWGLRYFCEHFDGYLWGPVSPRESEKERTARKEAAVGKLV